MAQIILNIPDADLPRVLDAFADTFDYPRYLAEGGTMTRGQFSKFHLVRWLKSIVRSYETRIGTPAPPAITDPDVT